MPNNLRISSRNTVLTSVGMALLVGFSVLGFGWNKLESLIFAPKPTLQESVSPASDQTSLSGDEADASTEEEEEIDRLALASQTHAVNAWGFLDKRQYWKAVGEAKRAIKLDPQNFDAYDVRDRAYRKLGIHNKKREVVIQGVMCDVRTGMKLLPAGMTRKERRELLSNETDITGMRITDVPPEGL